jgi:hypothetical protein
VALFKHVADMSNTHSLLSRMRRQRFAFFRTLLEQVPRPLTILDVGGTQFFWYTMHYAQDDQIRITILNVTPEAVWMPGMQVVVGDGCHMGQFADNSFDVVFSNSAIEHVGGFANQQAMASEIQRIGKRYFVQTPNRAFPIEPHFLVPCFQFLPLAVRVWLLQHFRLGWYHKIPDYEAARREVAAIRLLSKREVQRLFPGAHLRRETILWLTSSFIAYAGWE